MVTDGHSWWCDNVHGSAFCYSSMDGHHPTMIIGVVRDHVGPFCLGLGEQMSSAGVDSPHVQQLSQPFNKRLCTPIWSSWFTGMQDFPGLCLFWAAALGSHHSSCCHREVGNGDCPAPARCSGVEQLSRSTALARRDPCFLFVPFAKET